MIDVENFSQETIGKIATEETIKNTNSILNSAKNKISYLILQLNKSYKFYENAQSVQDLREKREAMLNKQISAEEERLSKITKNMTPTQTNQNAEVISESLEKDIKSLNKMANDSLKNIRNEMYTTRNQIAQNNEYIKIALEAITVIYQLRQKITGITEKIIIAYEDKDNNGKKILKSIEAPMIDFLKMPDIEKYITIITRASSSFRGGDPFQLGLKKSVISQMQGHLKTAQSSNIEYKLRRNTITTKDDLDKYLYSKGILRKEKGKYKIVKKGTAGYIVENILANIKNINKRTRINKRGNDEWFTGGDFTGMDESEYSAKSFLYGNPSFIKMSSLNRVLESLYDVLNIQNNDIYQNICNILGIDIKGLNAQINENIDESINQLFKGINLDIS